MHINLKKDTLSVLTSGEHSTCLQFECKILPELVLHTDEGSERLPGPIIEIECCSEQFFLLLNENGSWIKALTQYQYVSFVVAGIFRACEPVSKSEIGAHMINATDTDIFKRLTAISEQQNRLFSVVTMEDELLWTSSFENPFGDGSYFDWKRLNKKGHIPEELVRWKNQLYQNGSQLKMPVEILDFNRPHLASFEYRALHLHSWDTISVCVDAWGGTLDGTPVRIVAHTRPVFKVSLD